MKIETICENELKDLYHTRLQEDFPPDELRPYSSMEYLLGLGMYRCFAFREQGKTAAYALLIHAEGAALLDYFAVDPSLRGQGVGTRFLSELKSVSAEFGVPYVLIEAESPESARQNSFWRGSAACGFTKAAAACSQMCIPSCSEWNTRSSCYRSETLLFPARRK